MTPLNKQRATLIATVYKEVRKHAEINEDVSFDFEVTFADDTETESPLIVIVRKSYWNPDVQLYYKELDERYPHTISTIKEEIKKRIEEETQC